MKQCTRCCRPWRSSAIYPSSYTLTPNEVIAEFLKKDRNGSIDAIYDKLVKDAPAVKQAETKVEEAEASSTKPN